MEKRFVEYMKTLPSNEHQGLLYKYDGFEAGFKAAVNEALAKIDTVRKDASDEYTKNKLFLIMAELKNTIK